ncbi:MAG: fibronectin type III domain-containing protein, partial [Clostridiales bacterium]|nr:fibronectin type III domain-containing protein [Clostridiales bacterium]
TGGYGDDWDAFNEEWSVDWAVLEGSVTGIELTHEASAEPILRPATVTLANGGGPNVNNSLYNENTLDGKQVYIKIDTAENFQGDTLKVALRFTRVVGDGEYASYIHVIDFNITHKQEQTITSTMAGNILTYYGAKSFNLEAETSGNGKLTYKSSNKDVAKVSKNGQVSIVGTGKAVITITAHSTADYKLAVKKIVVRVTPGKAELKSVKAKGSGKLEITVKKDSMANGYMVQFSKDKTFKSSSTIVLDKQSRNSVTISKLKAGQKYYVRACAYTSIGGNKYCGVYSDAVKVKVK